MQEALLSVHALACRRGDRLLFSGLSLALTPGEALHVAGPNGIGKSSLIRILAGLARPFSGAVERKGTVALIDERPALDEQHTLASALRFWSSIDGGKAEDHAERLGIAALFDVPVRYLSTGQRKRAALARLLGQGAQVWLLDEPLNGLDTRGVALVEDLVAQHRAAGGVVVVASHQPISLPDAQVIDLREHGE